MNRGIGIGGEDRRVPIGERAFASPREHLSRFLYAAEKEIGFDCKSGEIIAFRSAGNVLNAIVPRSSPE